MRNCFLFSLFFLFPTLSPSFAQSLKPSDPKAGKETRFLYQNMQRLEKIGILMGHHDDLAYGVGWRGDSDRSI